MVALARALTHRIIIIITYSVNYINLKPECYVHMHFNDPQDEIIHLNQN